MTRELLQPAAAAAALPVELAPLPSELQGPAATTKRAMLQIVCVALNDIIYLSADLKVDILMSMKLITSGST